MIKKYQVKRLACYILLILIVSVVEGKAQNDNKAGLSYGIKAGINMSALTSNYIGLPDFKLGYQFGGFGTYPLMSDLSVELDLLFANLGSSTIDPAKLYVPGTPGANTIIKSSVRMNTLEIPVLAKFDFDLSGSKAYFVVGPEMILILSATAVNTRISSTGETTSKTDVTGSFRGSDLGGMIGLGLNLQKELSVEIRYRTGFSSINYVTSQSFSNFRINALSLNVGYSF